MTAPVGKTEASRDGSTSSIASSPEPEPATYTQDNPQQQQKRKGGRKPVSHPPAAPTACTHCRRSHDSSSCTIDHHVKDRANQASQDIRHL